MQLNIRQLKSSWNVIWDVAGLGNGQLLLRMHTAFFQAGSAVVESDQPADRICIVVSGRFVTAFKFCQPYPVLSNISHKKVS
jgi:hypothetical protein